jgi:hypothetical protein
MNYLGENAMLIMHKNCIGWDNLSDEQRVIVEDPAMSHDEGQCWFEILDGDESLQHELGESYTWNEIINGDYAECNDTIVAPEELRDAIESLLKSVGLTRQPQGSPYYKGEDRYRNVDTIN